MNQRLLIAGLFAASLLAACGGGSSYTEPTIPPVVINTPPPTASASIAGLVSYTAAQTALSADAEVVVLDDFVLPSGAMDSDVAVPTPNDA
ncbi:hypothetical protein BH11PSE10_BH11PSE10_07800 [soil metagenome]